MAQYLDPRFLVPRDLDQWPLASLRLVPPVLAAVAVPADAFVVGRVLVLVLVAVVVVVFDFEALFLGAAALRREGAPAAGAEGAVGGGGRLVPGGHGRQMGELRSSMASAEIKPRS